MKPIASLGSAAVLVTAPASMFVIEEATLPRDIPVRVPADAQLLDVHGNRLLSPPALSTLPRTPWNQSRQGATLGRTRLERHADADETPGRVADAETPVGSTGDSARSSSPRTGADDGGTP